MFRRAKASDVLNPALLEIQRAVTFHSAFVKMILWLRLILFCCGLLVFASGAFGRLIDVRQGEYQQTRDNKTMVWNGTPKPGETLSWSGNRDKENYANGFGDLTWYNAKGKVYALYYGNMVHGKFEGPVNLHTNGRTAHAYFADGGRVTGWARGPAPSKMAVPEEAVAERRKAEAENVAAQKHLTAAAPEPAKKPKAEPEKVRPMEHVASKPRATPAEPTPPAEAEEKSMTAHEKEKNAASAIEPTPIPTKSEIRSQKSEVRGSTESSAPALDRQVTKSAQPSIQETPPVAQEPATEQKTEVIGRTSEIVRESPPAPAKKESPGNVSLDALVGPPSSLRTTSIPETSSEKSETKSSSSENAPLTEAEAISLAETEARVQGYSLDDYERPKVDHSKVKGKWSLFYSLKEPGTTSENAAPFTVTVEDKTRKVEIRK